MPLETLVGNLVGGVLVPPAGGPMVRFSIGAGDRQALQPPAAPPLPQTHTSVHMLLRLLGEFPTPVLSSSKTQDWAVAKPTRILYSSDSRTFIPRCCSGIDVILVRGARIHNPRYGRRKANK